MKDLNLFAKLFSFGLLLLFVEVFKVAFPALLNFSIYDFNVILFFAAGITICLISLLFLLTEWVMLPYGTHVKRIKLYQGAGNLFAFTILVFGCLSDHSSKQNFLTDNSLLLSSGGLLVAVIFAWLGKPFANFYSRKKIKIEISAARDPLHFAETAR